MASLAWLAPYLLYYLPLTIATGSILYHLAVALAALRFRKTPEPSADFTPPVSILKPLKGIEPRFYESLAGFFRQQYPRFEIVFGLGSAKDPARWTIAQLRRDYPQVPVKVVIVENGGGANQKMNKLQRMVEEASHEVLVISDADIRVQPGYLREVVRPLAEERTGMVTCLYRGVVGGSLRSILEALGMSTEFAGQVLLARALRGMSFALGATMATRKRQIAEIGGVGRWADYLADDYILGSRMAAAGYRIHLSRTVVETLLPERSWRDFLQQQLRWARTIRACSPRGYPGLLFAYGAPLALFPMLYLPSPATLAVLAGAVLARLLSAWVTGVLVCRDRLAKAYFWLVPLRDVLALATWTAAFARNVIVWRQNRYRLEADGRIRPA